MQISTVVTDPTGANTIPESDLNKTLKLTATHYF